MTDISVAGHNSTIPFPTAKEDLSVVKEVLEAINDSRTRMDAERDLIKEKKKQLKNKFGLKPKLVTKLANTLFNDDFENTQMDHDEFVEAFKKVVGK